MSLRIAVWHDPPAGGAQRSLSELLAGLHRRGHLVDVYRLGQAHADATAEAAYGLRTVPLPFTPRPHLRRGLYLNDLLTLRDMQDEERLERDLAAQIDAAGYDVVFASVLRWGNAPELLRYAATPTLYFCHEPPRRFYEPWCRPQAAPLSTFERGRLLWRAPAQRLLDRRLRTHDLLSVRAATRVMTNSQYTRDRIRTVYGCDAQVCYPGVDGGRFTPGCGGRGGGVLSVGALHPHKGFDFLIAALGCLPAAQRPPLTVVGFGGHPATPGYLRGLAEHCGVRLDLRSSVTDDELVRLYQSADVFGFGARMEPFGLVVLEAMAAGLPVVAVAEGGVPEMVVDGETGFLTPREPEAFADRVAEVLASGPLRQRLGAAGRQQATTRWTWDATLDGLERLLAATAGRQPVAVAP